MSQPEALIDVIGIVQDPHMKALLTELKRVNAQAQELLAEVRAIQANCSHELLMAQRGMQAWEPYVCRHCGTLRIIQC